MIKYVLPSAPAAPRNEGGEAAFPFPSQLRCSDRRKALILEDVQETASRGSEKRTDFASRTARKNTTAPHPVLPTQGSMCCTLQRRNQKVQTLTPVAAPWFCPTSSIEPMSCLTLRFSPCLPTSLYSGGGR